MRTSVEGNRSSRERHGCWPVLADAKSRQNSCRLDMQRLLAGQIQHLGLQEVVIYKPRWGAFYQTLLEVYIRQHYVSTLIFTGCNFPNCPRTSIYEASERDFRVVVVEDAISGIYERGKEELRNIGVTIMKAENVRDQLLQVVFQEEG